MRHIYDLTKELQNSSIQKAEIDKFSAKIKELEERLSSRFEMTPQDRQTLDELNKILDGVKEGESHNRGELD